MSIINQKKEVFGNIAALRTLNEGFPLLKLNSSFPSINNNTNSLDFLIDLLKSLIGYEELREMVVDTIVYKLGDIEEEVKKTLKKELKSLVSCGVDPSIPDYVKYNGSGVNFELKNIDFFDLMKVDPESKYGGLLYDDIDSGVGSTDFNTMLYNTVQSQAEQTWGQSTTSVDILALDFDAVGTPTANNIVNIKASQQYSTGAKTLTDLNNDFIDSIQLFGSEQMITNIIDSIFGSLSSVIDKSEEQLENEAKIRNTLECILNTDNNAVIDDSYFEFSNEDIQIAQEDAKNRKKGIRKLETCSTTQSSVSVDTLLKMKEQLSGTCVGCEEQKEVVSDSIDAMANETTFDEPSVQNKYSIQLNFIELMLKRLMLSIVNFIISPKIVTIFVLNFIIIYGQGEEFEDGVDFMRKNKTLIKKISNKIRDKIIGILLQEVLISIGKLVGQNAAKKQAEKGKKELAQLLSLVGVPSEFIRKITGLI